MKRKGQTQPKQ